MGSCLSRALISCGILNPDSTSENNPENSVNNSSEKNKPLKRTLHTETNFKIDSSWTFEELQKQRAAFWDTAPCYDGREEIWQALKAAVSAIQENNQENNSTNPDYDHAQIILDSVGVTLPTGSLELCYDELGTVRIF